MARGARYHGSAQPRKPSRPIRKSRDDLLAKLDGCTATGAPDRNDWIVACGVQCGLGSALASLIEALERLL